MSDKYYMSWDEVLKRLTYLDMTGEIYYGIPKGGMCLSAYLKNAKVTHNPMLATAFLDDIIDSGATQERYFKKYRKPVVAIVDKIREPLDKELGWIVFPWERHEDEEKSITDSVTRQLQFLGEDVEREGLRETPERVVKSWSRLYGGYSQDPKAILKTFAEGACDEMVVLKNIEFYSTCEHHMLPFFGKAHIAYIPNKKVAGISKLARLLEVFARRLQIQERIGAQVTNVIMKELNALGAACILEAQHFCMTARGVEKQNSIMVTSSLQGAFKDKPETRSELMRLIR